MSVDVLAQRVAPFSILKPEFIVTKLPEISEVLLPDFNVKFPALEILPEAITGYHWLFCTIVFAGITMLLC